ncbi:hypothetical protein HBI56_110880 [Parastagonospora nodorum]|nr:hypothetical protein HBH53_130430 [Parastagonospora nodorum]KAH3973031.1 hypothetical protein HBH52_143320 [Parastagonospora nodorum]KAH3980800.1 hypothetical protein HBH51_049250 [Parastagonospora nodorum]KAH4038560.1 hypothetical protein HBI09_052870 [Parastagonospora nodorum]KAH4055595.1 hypothetical protein HBH49_061260 [Parastagonospora nodorum]
MPRDTMDRKASRALHKQQSEQREAHLTAMAKAKRVFISGLKGHHPFQLGVAYHFRGHQLYSFPGGEPIAPVPFKFKYGISIVSEMEGAVPVFDRCAEGLREEGSIAALDKSCWVFWEEAEAEKSREKEEVRRTLEAETCVDDEGGVELAVVQRNSSRATRELPKVSYPTALVPAQVLSRGTSRAPSREASQVDLSVLAATGDTPRPRSMRFVTPASTTDLASMVMAEGLLTAPRALHRASSSDLASKPVPAFARKLQHLSSQPDSSLSLADLATRHNRSKSGGISLSNIDGLGNSTSLASKSTIPGLGHSDSSPSLTSLNRERTTTTGPSMSSILAFAHPHLSRETFNTPHDHARFLSDSLPGSRLTSVVNTPFPSRPVSPALRPIASTSHLQIPSTVQGTHTLFADMLDLYAYTYTDLSTMVSPQYGRNEVVGSGRPRRASMALNQAYNAGRMGEEGVGARAPKCAVHGEECDGVAVMETWKTERAQQTSGFREVYPMIEGEGARVMVDWAHLLREEQERLQN